MKKIILIAFLLIGLTGAAQKFSDVLRIKDTLADGNIEFETKYQSKYAYNKDTISFEIYMVFDVKTKTVLVEGMFIWDKSYATNYQFMFEGGSAIFKRYDKEVDEFFTTKGVEIELLQGKLKAIRKNGNAYLPVGASEDYIKLYTTNFERIKCEWF